jgi:hypothetical protein
MRSERTTFYRRKRTDQDILSKMVVALCNSITAADAPVNRNGGIPEGCACSFPALDMM